MRQSTLRSATLLLAMLLTFASPAVAQVDEEDLRAGLVAEITTGEITTGAKRLSRIDPNIAFRVATGAEYDSRLKGGPFGIRWRGNLQSQSPGDYQLFAQVEGAVQVRLNGRTIIEAKADSPTWVASAPLKDLPFDWHPIDIQFASSDGRGELRLFWSGPGFTVEPIGARWWFHEPDAAANTSAIDGGAWVDALRCAACHRQAVAETPLHAPSLRAIKGQLKADWLIDWLQQKSPAADAETEMTTPLKRRMPYYGLSEDDAIAIAAFLLHQADSPRLAELKNKNKKKGKKEKPESPHADKGRRIALTVGCLACHTIGEVGEDNLFGGSDLTHIANKRPKSFFANWLRQPERLIADHRMPVFELSPNETAHLAEYLNSCQADTNGSMPLAAKLERATGDAAVVAQGRRLAEKHNCAACHDIADLRFKSIEIRTAAGRDPGCAGDATEMRPGYGLAVGRRKAVATYFHELLASNAESPASATTRVSGAVALRRRNCTSCHQREGSPGLARRLSRTIEDFPELASQTPAMTPPSLISVGDKLRDEALSDAIAKPDNSHRPWLLVRMPKYRLEEGELNPLVRHLIVSDRIPDAGHSYAAPSSEQSHGVVGARLVTPDGFGCTSCHQVGGVKPPKAPLNAKGPNLSELGKRIRFPWYQRWVRNPARIVPRMEMPSVQLSVSGVLDNDLNRQLDTVWNVLNDPKFKPPAPNPVRVVRARGVKSAGESTQVLTDVLNVGESQFIKPLILGLPNRHNVFYDLENGRLAGWWIGDAARQRTKGKTWFWEAGAENLFKEPLGNYLLELDGQAKAPSRVGQFITELDRWRHDEGAVEFHHRLHFGDAEQRQTVVSIRQRVEPLWSNGSQHGGWRQSFNVTGLPNAATLSIPIVSEVIASNAKLNNKALRWDAPLGGQLEVVASQACEPDGRVVLRADSEGRAKLKLDYLASIEPDRFPAPPILPNLEKAVVIDSTPGFESVRLPVSGDVMPTGLAWRPDGSLIITSLKGRVWLAKDSDGDGLEDKLDAFSDELAAPFGAHATDDYIDVINKYSLLRLFDRDQDGRAEETQTLASGWGHTADYHDWAIGLPRDKNGNYWIATACEQDKRSAAAAALRGVVMKLTPRTPTREDPRAFQTQTVTSGHRFPIGIALNHAGHAFVTDNQGNYNPFNELNHIVAGRSYGFINSIDRRPDFDIPPLTAAAVKVPHPWTRSVNGICFLETPGDGEPAFGPFEGHLIGAEYDTRRLVRISLEEVNGEYQGGVYPFSDYHPSGGATFLGPLTCAVSPKGELYVGCIRDSGWGGANNIGTVVRMRPQLDRLPAGIAEVRAAEDGFVIHFTKAVDVERAADPNNFAVSSYTRQSTPAYGGDDKQRRKESIHSVRVRADGRAVEIRLNEMRPGFVYEFRLRNLARNGSSFFPAEAFYSLNEIPRN